MISYSYTLEPEDIGKKIFFELTLASQPSIPDQFLLFFGYQNKGLCQLTVAENVYKTKMTVDNWDTNAVYGQKDYHHLLLDTFNRTVGETFYFCVANLYGAASTFSYSFKITKSTDIPCPRNCSNKGVCNNGVCQCNYGFIDDDCSKVAEPLKVGASNRRQINPLSWKYYWIDFENVTPLFQVKISKQKPPLEVNFKFEDQGLCQIPNKFELLYLYYIPESLSERVWTVSKKAYTSRLIQDSKLLIGVYNPSKSEIVNITMQQFNICLLYTSPSPRDS
eukprot:TRINITY_DN8793_c0_g1_i1.p1 TRINITY_DN8793_c0_g1~~TRINITY_DN8793_c0_g1_i1.p1  ORF type:complete len:278 (+),score=23.95 TRINITY_DN8793_c0_g1_i1:227-1060(+)